MSATTIIEVEECQTCGGLLASDGKCETCGNERDALAVCLYCGQTFRPGSIYQEYCCDECEITAEFNGESE